VSQPRTEAEDLPACAVTPVPAGRNVFLDGAEPHHAFAQTVGAADFPSEATDSTTIGSATVTAGPADGAADMEAESVRWKVSGRGRKLLLHEPVIAWWNASLQGACNAWPMGAEVSDMEWY